MFGSRSRRIGANGKLSYADRTIGCCDQLSARRERFLELVRSRTLDCSCFGGAEAPRNRTGRSHHSPAMRGCRHDGAIENRASVHWFGDPSHKPLRDRQRPRVGATDIHVSNVLPVADGLITGRAIHFLFGAVAGVGCPHNGAIQDIDESGATELRASGRCIISGPSPVACAT